MTTTLSIVRLASRREITVNVRGKSLILCLVINAIALSVLTQAEDSTFVGKWDSTINNLIDHPKTVALRIEVVDNETQEPIPNVSISFEGEYWISPRTSRHPEGERQAQEMEYKVSCQTDSDGIAVGAFGWQKEYPWRLGVDEVEKAQRIEIRHSRYKYVERRTPFYRFLQVGQKKAEELYLTNDDEWQEPHVVETFEKNWALECAKHDVKFYVLDLGADYKVSIRNNQWSRNSSRKFGIGSGALFSKNPRT